MSLFNRSAGNDEGQAKERKGGNSFLGLFVIMLTLALAGFSYNSYSRGSSRVEASGLSRIAALLGADFTPLRLGLSREPSGLLRVKATLLDREGKEVCVLEKALSGSSVAVDFWLLQAGPQVEGKWLAIPYRIYTDSTAADSGLALLEASLLAGVPAVFEGQPASGSALDQAGRKALVQAVKGLGRSGQGGQRYTILLPVLQDDAIYDIVMGDSGSARLRPTGRF